MDMDTWGCICAYGDGQLFWEVNHITKPNSLFQDRWINACCPARHWDITEHKCILLTDINRQENTQPSGFCSAEAWFPPPASANHPSAFCGDQRRALGSPKPPLPAWCHATNVLLEASPGLSCGLDVQRRRISHRMIVRWLWNQIPG